MRPITVQKPEVTDREDLVERLHDLRQHALVLGGLAICWWIAAAFQGAYLSDVTVQAVAVNAFLPDTLQWVGHIPAWILAVPGFVNALAALVVVQLSHGRLLPFDVVERYSVEGWLRALQVLTFGLALAYGCGALAILYYISLSPYGL